MYTIICTFDPFGKGRHKYTFRNLCVEDNNIELGDETNKVFLNKSGTIVDVDDEEGREEGRKEGRTEEKIEMARKLLVRGMSIDEVASITELAREKVASLIQ